MIAQLRAELESIQRREPTHTRIGKTAVRVVDTSTYQLTTQHVCPRCPSRKACRAASLRLADAEMKAIGGGG